MLLKEFQSNNLIWVLTNPLFARNLVHKTPESPLSGEMRFFLRASLEACIWVISERNPTQVNRKSLQVSLLWIVYTVVASLTEQGRPTSRVARKANTENEVNSRADDRVPFRVY